MAAAVVMCVTHEGTRQYSSSRTVWTSLIIIQNPSIEEPHAETQLYTQQYVWCNLSALQAADGSTQAMCAARMQEKPQREAIVLYLEGKT